MLVLLHSKNEIGYSQKKQFINVSALFKFFNDMSPEYTSEVFRPS